MSKRILLVDDEAHVVRVMALGLKRAGYEVATAADGQQGFDSFAQLQPDALIADIDMPRMDGVEMCNRICAEYPDTRCRIFVSTSRAELDLRRWIKTLGRVSLLEKPISMRTLNKELAAHFHAANDAGGTDAAQ